MINVDFTLSSGLLLFGVTEGPCAVVILIEASAKEIFYSAYKALLQWQKTGSSGEILRQRQSAAAHTHTHTRTVNLITDCDKCLNTLLIVQ